MFSGENHDKRAVGTAILNGVLAVCGVLALGLFVWILGWPLDGKAWLFARWGTWGVLGVFVAQEIGRFFFAGKVSVLVRARKVELLLAVLVAGEFFFAEVWGDWFYAQFPEIRPDTLILSLLACSQLTLLLVGGLRLLRRSSLVASRRITPGMLFILSFALLILVGTLLLKPPLATPHGISWVDALFTATSAVCVTGLTTVEVATDFTRHGHCIILGLVQIGGLGIMTLTYFFAYFLAGGVSLRNRIAMQNLLSEDNLSQIGTILGIIIGFTFGCEIVGAFAIHYFFVDAGLAGEDPVFFAIFHAVTAFCNAGMSTLPGNLEDVARGGNEGLLAVIMVLVVLGGIGFPVVKNLWNVTLAIARRKIGLRKAIPPRLTTHSRVVLVTSGVLLVGGAALLYLTEYGFGAGEAGGVSPWFAALFCSVTARSAGFNITDTSLLSSGSMILLIALMFVGGSPSSTAGGIKTSTVAVAFLSLRRVVLGLPSIEVFGRKIADETADRALAVVLVALSFAMLVAAILCATFPLLPPLDILFEVVSALGTTGLGRGISGELNAAGKLLLVVTMFVGRIGVLFFLLSVIPKREHTEFHYPEGTIIIS